MMTKNIDEVEPYHKMTTQIIKIADVSNNKIAEILNINKSSVSMKINQKNYNKFTQKDFDKIKEYFIKKYTEILNIK